MSVNKAKIKTFAWIFIMILLSSCGHEEHNPNPEQGIKHELRKFNVKTSTSEKTEAFFFIIVGSYESSKTEETNVRFYFKNCRGEFQFQELPLTNVRIKIDSAVVNPFVMFDDISRYTYNESLRCYETDYRDVISGYAVVYCKENDFQPEININDLR